MSEDAKPPGKPLRPHRPHRGIDGRIDTFKVDGEPGAVTHRGWCRVKDGSVRAGDVLLLQVPDPPPRTTRVVCNLNVSDDGTYAEIEIVDRPVK